MNILALLFALLFPQAAPPFSAQVSVQVFHGTAPFRGTIQVYDATDPLNTVRVGSWDLDANGQAAALVTLDRHPPYQWVILNDSHTKGCPCMRGFGPLNLHFLEVLDPQPNIAFQIHMDGAADANGLYPNIYPRKADGTPFVF